MMTDDSFKILRLRFLRPPPAVVTLPREQGSRKPATIPMTLAVGVTDDYGSHVGMFDSLDLHLQLLDPLTSLPLPHLSLTLDSPSPSPSSSPPSSSFTLTPSSGPYTTLRLTLHIPITHPPPPAFRILLAVKPSSQPPPRLEETSESMRTIIGEEGQDVMVSWEEERFVFMRAMSGEVEIRRGGGKGGEGVASNEKVQIIYRTIHLPSSSASSSALPPLTVVERPGLNNSTGQRLWDCAIGMSCWLSLHPEVFLPSPSPLLHKEKEGGEEPPTKRPRRTREGAHLLLELGAGSALATLSAATLLQHLYPKTAAAASTRLLATDVQETVETTLSENLDFNSSSSSSASRLPIGTSILPWGSLSPTELAALLPSPPPRRLTILGADILYNPSSHTLLLDTLLSLLPACEEGEWEGRAFIAYKKRTEGDEGFFERAREAGFEVVRVWCWGEVGVWRVERGRGRRE
ncbi:hypothetical protein BCR35DRAFT_17355 [Leucosporidium creatinivorum]|uniref:Methyltransferase-domain-containing protein n=1 Tax=Leucosporidium creatinivorum TaxID=106004 RepID=A0A1Y2D457_9BASI|nr:hypothetical protein BCR35DRAFT_17355 [Leucosporidium creatinivorum]